MSRGSKADEHGAGLGLGKLLCHDGDGRGRRYLAQVKAANSVGNREKIAVGTSLLARSRDKETHGVFIVGANLAEIACLTELCV